MGLRVIFLDIDGVLNRTRSASHVRVDDDLVARLRFMLEGADARVVFTTFWRGFSDYLTYLLSRFDIDPNRVIGSTAICYHSF